MAAPTNSSGLYLVLEPGEGARERLAAALTAAPAQAVLVRPRIGGPGDLDAVRALVEQIQRQGCAALIEDDARMARTLRADGVHLTWNAEIGKRYAEARDVLGNRYIVGVMAGASRHDAMELAEAGADYIGFGLGDAPDEAATARELRLEYVAWWAEIFEIPCVGFDVDNAAEAAELIQAGADFVGLHLRNGSAPGAAADLVRATLALADGRNRGDT